MPQYLLSISPIVNSLRACYIAVKDVSAPLGRYKPTSFNRGNYFSLINNVTPAILSLPWDAKLTVIRCK